MSRKGRTHRQKTTEVCSGWIWQTRGSSLLLLLGRHALCGYWLWTCKDYALENCLEEVQGATACSFITPPLLQDPRSCVQLMHLECDASCKRDLARDLALDQSRSPALTGQWKKHDQTDLKCEARECGYCQIQRAVGWTWDRWPWRYSEREKALLVNGHVERSSGAIKRIATCR